MFTLALSANTAQAQSFTSFPDSTTACEESDIFLTYRSGDGLTNITCAQIAQYIQNLTSPGGSEVIPGPPVVESFGFGYELDGTITTTAPTDITNDENLIVIAAVDYVDAATSTVALSGFDTIVPYTRANAGAAGTALQVFEKATNNESGAYTVTESTNVKTATIALRISGAKTDDPIDVYACSTGTTEPVTAPSVDVTVDDSRIIRIFAWDQDKSVTLAPAGVTAIYYNNQSGIDLWAGESLQSTAGASQTAVMDITGAAPWVACTIAVREKNAVATGGGGGAVIPQGAGPFSLGNDGTGNAIKITLPIAQNGTFVGSAWEIFPSNSVSWQSGSEDLLTYEHPTYFKRYPTYYEFCSPNTGATTSNAQNGRSELRYLANVSSGVMSRQFIWRVPVDGMANNAKANVGQIHRVEASPVFKGTVTYKSDGSGVYRMLVKKTNGGSDFAYDIGLGDKTVLNSIEGGDFIVTRYYWTISTGELRFWVLNAGQTLTGDAATGTGEYATLSGTPTATITGVLMDSAGAYSKLGMYMNSAGDGLNTTPMCVQVYQDKYTGP